MFLTFDDLLLDSDLYHANLQITTEVQIQAKGS